jgi:hypothetical protein
LWAQDEGDFDVAQPWTKFPTFFSELLEENIVNTTKTRQELL